MNLSAIPKRIPWPLAALVLVALIGTGCSAESADDGDAGAGYENAAEFSECMRANGVSGFPDPDSSGELTIDGVLNGSSLDPNTTAWKQAIEACRDLQPSGFTGDDEVTAEQQKARLAFAECMRVNGVEDFPDPVKGQPLVDTNRIPSAGQAGGMDTIDAAMEACGDDAEKAIGQ